MAAAANATNVHMRTCLVSAVIARASTPIGNQTQALPSPTRRIAASTANEDHMRAGTSGNVFHARYRPMGENMTVTVATAASVRARQAHAGSRRRRKENEEQCDIQHDDERNELTADAKQSGHPVDQRDVRDPRCGETGNQAWLKVTGDDLREREIGSGIKVLRLVPVQAAVEAEDSQSRTAATIRSARRGGYITCLYLGRAKCRHLFRHPPDDRLAELRLLPTDGICKGRAPAKSANLHQSPITPA